MKKLKERKSTKTILAIALSVVFFTSAISTAVFAVNGDESSETDPTTSSSVVQDSDSSDTSSDSSDSSSESSSDSSSDNSSQSSSESSSDNNSSSTSQQSTTATPVKPETPNNSLAVGTKFTVGNYMYMVKGENSVSLKGFAKNVSLSTVDIKTKVTYKGVTYNITKIGTEAFKGENGIKKVIIRPSITDIGKRAFLQCKNITKVRIKTGTKIIRKGAFRYCSKLKTINITSTVLTDIRENVFNGIKSGAVVNVMNEPVRTLVKANIPKNVTVNMM